MDAMRAAIDRKLTVGAYEASNRTRSIVVLLRQTLRNRNL